MFQVTRDQIDLSLAWCGLGCTDTLATTTTCGQMPCYRATAARWREAFHPLTRPSHGLLSWMQANQPVPLLSQAIVWQLLPQLQVQLAVPQRIHLSPLDKRLQRYRLPGQDPLSPIGQRPQHPPEAGGALLLELSLQQPTPLSLCAGTGTFRQQWPALYPGQ